MLSYKPTVQEFYSTAIKTENKDEIEAMDMKINKEGLYIIIEAKVIGLYYTKIFVLVLSFKLLKKLEHISSHSVKKGLLRVHMKN